MVPSVSAHERYPRVLRKWKKHHELTTAANGERNKAATWNTEEEKSLFIMYNHFFSAVVDFLYI